MTTPLSIGIPRIDTASGSDRRGLLPIMFGGGDDFIQCFNHERPHQALNMKYPAELYSPSPRPYTGLSEVEYPFHDRTITVTQCGRICIGRRKINLSGVSAGQNVGITEVSEKIRLVSFVQYDLGFFDHESGRVECMKWCARTDCFGAYGPSSCASLRTAAVPCAAASNPARRRVVEPSCYLSAVRTALFKLRHTLPKYFL